MTPTPMTLDDVIDSLNNTSAFDGQEEYRDGWYDGLRYCVNYIIDNRAALEAGMRPPLRFKWHHYGNFQGWFLCDKDGNVIESIVSSKDSAIEYANFLGLRAEFAEKPK